MSLFDTPPVLVLRRGPRPETSWLSPASWLGGRPGLGDLPWPRSEATGLPLHFVAQIDCNALRSVAPGGEVGHDGALAFFITPLDQWLQGVVLAVPPSGKAAFVAPPDDTPPIGEPSIGHANIAQGAQSYPYWPVDLMPESANVPETPRCNYKVAVQEADGFHGLPETVFWDTAHRMAAMIAAVAEALPENRGGEASRVAQKRQALEEARQEVARLGPPAPFIARLFGKGPTPQQVSDAAATVATLEAELTAMRAERAELLDRFSSFIADVTAWRAAQDPLEMMAPADRAQLLDIGKRLRTDFKTLTRGQACNPRDYASFTVREFVVGDDRTAALVPEGERARLAAEYRSPAQAHHRMLGQPVQIQDEFYGHDDKTLLLQLHYDALMCFYFGDVGQVSFLIAPEDLAEGRFDRVAMTTACH
ncbi:MAG: DUF1963 domain-containing protein [Pseudomonadota bacterium]